MSEPPLSRVLLVEDDPDIQALACFALAEVGGFDVELCASGPEAVEKAPRFRPEIVLLDVMMPGMDGWATLRALRRLPQTAVTPVVIMTARAQPQEVDAYRRAGACDVVVKPFEPAELPELLRGIWRRIHGEADRRPA
jgi:DNA-binding response OmpR family regulator